VDPRVGLDDMEKRKFLPPPALELRPLGCTARRQSPYRLSYFGSCSTKCLDEMNDCQLLKEELRSIESVWADVGTEGNV
jgi:hypothetical protein